MGIQTPHQDQFPTSLESIIPVRNVVDVDTRPYDEVLRDMADQLHVIAAAHKLLDKVHKEKHEQIMTLLLKVDSLESKVKHYREISENWEKRYRAVVIEKEQLRSRVYALEESIGRSAGL